MDADDKYELLNEVGARWNAETDVHKFYHGINVRP